MVTGVEEETPCKKARTEAISKAFEEDSLPFQSILSFLV